MNPQEQKTFDALVEALRTINAICIQMMNNGVPGYIAIQTISVHALSKVKS